MSDHELTVALCDKELKWSWSRAIIGVWKAITSPALWTVMFFIMVIGEGYPENEIMWYGIIVLGFMFHKPLSKLIETGKLAVEARLGANFERKKSE